LFEDQLACADIVLLNKTDLVDADRLAELEAGLAKDIRAGVRIVRTDHGRIDPAILLGLDAAAEDDADARPSHHDNEEDHDHDDFDSFVLDLPEIDAVDGLLATLAETITAHDILRVKGFIAVAGRPARLVLQAVGPRIQHHYDRPWAAGEARQSRIVVIGQTGLDRAAITTALRADVSAGAAA
jgi:cobalamin biosynthesis protein CobW